MKLPKAAYLTQTSMTPEELFQLIDAGYTVFIMNPELHRNVLPFLDLAFDDSYGWARGVGCKLHIVDMS